MKTLIPIAILAAALCAAGCSDSASPTAGDTAKTAADDPALAADHVPAGSVPAGLTYDITARSPRLNRKVMGETTDEVMGVAAAPVHSFVWDGDGSVEVRGSARLRIDPVANTGRIQVNWIDHNGSWRLTQEVFTAPDHASGLLAAPDGSTTLLEGDAVPQNVYLHGGSTAGGPVLPLVFNHLATWGVAEVTLDGEPFVNPYDGPSPHWAAHTMFSIGVRDGEGRVHTVDGGIFDPTVTPDNGAVDAGDLEFHVVFHDAPGPVTNNFPPPFSFFYHLTFEDLKVSIGQRD